MGQTFSDSGEAGQRRLQALEICRVLELIGEIRQVQTLVGLRRKRRESNSYVYCNVAAQRLDWDNIKLTVSRFFCQSIIMLQLLQLT